MRISDWSSDVCSSDLPPHSDRRKIFVQRTRPRWVRDNGLRASSSATASRSSRCSISSRRSQAIANGGIGAPRIGQIGRAHVRTPVTNAHLVCRLLLEKKKKTHNQSTDL